MYVYEGQAISWFETGMEGVRWAIQLDGVDGYSGLVLLEAGDKLTVTNPNGDILFDGIIDPNCEIGRRPRAPGSSFQQPAALGLWIHWTQEGFSPDSWARLFVRCDNRCRLVRPDPICIELYESN